MLIAWSWLNSANLRVLTFLTLVFLLGSHVILQLLILCPCWTFNCRPGSVKRIVHFATRVKNCLRLMFTFRDYHFENLVIRCAAMWFRRPVTHLNKRLALNHLNHILVQTLKLYCTIHSLRLLIWTLISYDFSRHIRRRNRNFFLISCS